MLNQKKKGHKCPLDTPKRTERENEREREGERERKGERER